MKKNIYYLKLTILFTAITFLMGCETGVRNKGEKTTVAPSGIVDKGSNGYVGSQKTSGNIKTPKIFSNSATPGYYLQVGYFAQAKPNHSFMKRLNNSSFNHTIVDKNGDHYALVGAYYSYNQAKNKTSAVRSALNNRAFIVQVLRP